MVWSLGNCIKAPPPPVASAMLCLEKNTCNLDWGRVTPDFTSCNEFTFWGETGIILALLFLCLSFIPLHHCSSHLPQLVEKRTSKAEEINVFLLKSDHKNSIGRVMSGIQEVIPIGWSWKTCAWSFFFLSVCFLSDFLATYQKPKWQLAERIQTDRSTSKHFKISTQLSLFVHLIITFSSTEEVVNKTLPLTSSYISAVKTRIKQK